MASLVVRFSLNPGRGTRHGVRCRRHGFSAAGTFVAIDSLAAQSVDVDIIKLAVRYPTALLND